MTSPASTSSLGSTFNGFLYAQIYKESDDRLLSVLSALARLNLDPWKEAADLAQLPKEPATHRLASLLARLPADPSMPADVVALADGLISLLPNRATGVSIAQLLRHGEDPQIPFVAPNYFVLTMLMASILFGLVMMSDRQQPEHPGNVSTSVTDTVSKQVPGAIVPDR